MLVSLHVKNMALIREAEVEFQEGLNIMTGETGAGKSIVIGSINIALGTGNFKDYVPEGEDYALVELIFETDNPRVFKMLEEQDIPYEDGEIVLTRRYKSGRSTSKINGETVTVSFVRELAPELIDIFGQHEHQSLLYEKNHLEILDSFAKEETAPLLKEYHLKYHAYQEAKRKFENARSSEAERSKELDLLQYEIEEIRSASLHAGEDEELENSYRLMANGQKIAETLSEAGNLTGAGGYGGASDEISRAARDISGIRSYDQSLEELSDTIDDIESLIGEFNRSLSEYMDNLVFDQQKLNDTGERLDLINRLKVKYGNSIEKILKSCEEKEERADILQNYEAYLEKLQMEYTKSRESLYDIADKLSAARKKYALILSDEIRKALLDLNFLDVRFMIRFSNLSEPSENGSDEVCFMISMNPGLPLRPLQSVASGGELSRIMLAVKTVMADKDNTETLIFDEIDSGISGRTAQKVSEKMALIARKRQVICITHLAQIAAMADRHFIIEKKPSDSKTVTNIGLLSEEDSIKELARILGGAKITEAVIENAREMRALALETKKL